MPYYLVTISSKKKVGGPYKTFSAASSARAEYYSKHRARVGIYRVQGSSIAIMDTRGKVLRKLLR